MSLNNEAIADDAEGAFSKAGFAFYTRAECLNTRDPEHAPAYVEYPRVEAWEFGCCLVIKSNTT